MAHHFIFVHIYLMQIGWTVSAIVLMHLGKNSSFSMAAISAA